MDGGFPFPKDSLCDVQKFGPNSTATGNGWSTWRRRPGVRMITIICVGGAGNGGLGAIGLNSAAAGGGGGGSGGQSIVTMPAATVPEVLFLSVGYKGIASRVAIRPDVQALNCVAFANAGSVGGNAAAGTAGASGGAAGVATISNMPLAGLGSIQLLAGQAGVIGGAAIGGGGLALPVTGIRLTGGTGGGGLPAAAASGTVGGSIAAASAFPALSGGSGTATATVPGGNGSHGLSVVAGVLFNYGGTGGGSTHGSATGAGLFSGAGGDGAPGCGGGGSGGGLTGSVVGVPGGGGPGFIQIIGW